MEIKVDNLRGDEIIRLLKEHMQDMLATSPIESVHALDVTELQDPAVTFYSCWEKELLLGCVAIKELTPWHGELKSMRTASSMRSRGVASNLLEHVLITAECRGYHKISLETGSMDFFKPARNLYEKYGFKYCEPFADYQPDPNSSFMCKEISNAKES